MAGFVYLIEAAEGHLFKIGATRRRAEIRAHQVIRDDTPGVLIWSLNVERPFGLERWLHKRFAPHRVRGEWFTLPPPDVLWVTALQSDPRPLESPKRLDLSPKAEVTAVLPRPQPNRHRVEVILVENYRTFS